MCSRETSRYLNVGSRHVSKLSIAYSLLVMFRNCTLDARSSKTDGSAGQTECAVYVAGQGSTLRHIF